MEQQWETLNTGHLFTFSFMDVQAARMYESENRLLNIVGVFSVMAILIACMGLLGLSQYTLQKRRKEIGVRKVLGASIGKILVIVGKDFTLLIFITLLVAVSSAYWLSNQWLKDFAYRIDVSLLLLHANPVDALRDE